MCIRDSHNDVAALAAHHAAHHLHVADVVEHGVQAQRVAQVCLLYTSSVAIPGETGVRVNGQPATLADAAEQAGPAQAAAALMETLDIEMCIRDRRSGAPAAFCRKTG